VRAVISESDISMGLDRWYGNGGKGCTDTTSGEGTSHNFDGGSLFVFAKTMGFKRKQDNYERNNCGGRLRVHKM